VIEGAHLSRSSGSNIVRHALSQLANESAET
jgi:hypothetical protein